MDATGKRALSNGSAASVSHGAGNGVRRVQHQSGPGFPKGERQGERGAVPQPSLWFANDHWQRRAFEIIAGSFVLSFYSDDTDDGEVGRGFHTQNQTYINEKRCLEVLVEERKRQSKQLICLLHGPGGSGKTTAIDLLMEYAQEYCSFMEHYEFTSRTIVVTAMTGVAATLLLGETTHAAVYLNQKKAITSEQVDHWKDTHLLIIDEISFASKVDFEKLHKHLRRLKQNLHLPYGGLNIVFAGDMRQLEPVGDKRPVYEETCPEFKDWVNCFIDLDGILVSKMIHIGDSF